MKLVLGTVQFGIPYGINNSKGIPSDNEISDILNLAYKESINYIDTAISYGNAEKKISKLSENKFNIITKSNNIKTKVELLTSISNSLKRLKVNAVYGYLFHNSDNLIKFPELWDTLMEIKNLNKTKKIGCSVYNTDQLDKILDKGILPDIVQLPYSLLDRKFQKYFPKLKSLGVEIHVRSIFLQGLYFMDIKKLPLKIIPLKKSLLKLHHLCAKLNILIGELALNFVYNNPYIDKVIIGFDSMDQLYQNINMIKNWNNKIKINESVNKINVTDENLLNPTNWN